MGLAYDIFVLVWGERFVRDFVEVALPFQLAEGNLPALSQADAVNYHIYTDRESRAWFGDVDIQIGAYADLLFHYFDEIFVGEDAVSDRLSAARGSETKYQTQHDCALHLLDLIGEDSGRAIVILDPNFILADGTFAAMDARRRGGAKAVMVNALRLDRERALPRLRDIAAGATTNPRTLFNLAISYLHPMAQTAFHDAPHFSPYPSQIYWRVGATGISGRCFIPHPLMVTNHPALRSHCSTMDYELALRGWSDNEIYFVGDSDEILICKFSDGAHVADRVTGPPPTATNLALFCVTSTHHRHRQFAEVPLRFHAEAIDSTWTASEQEAGRLIDDCYAEIEGILAQSGRLDARFLMHLKSYTGPIEDFTSPQLEPAALASLGASEHPETVSA